jgi:hydrogenase maturation protease
VKKIGVYGIGNVLIGDDAVGPTVVNLLDALWEFPEGVVVEDLGTPSLDLAYRLTGLDAVIFVDAVSAKLEPGTIRLYRRDEILKNPPGLRLSPHDPSLKETLLTCEFLGDCPKDIILVGVVPEAAGEFGLSAAVQAAVPLAAAAVIEELARLGAVARQRAGGGVVRPWWHAA